MIKRFSEIFLPTRKEEVNSHPMYLETNYLLQSNLHARLVSPKDQMLLSKVTEVTFIFPSQISLP